MPKKVENMMRVCVRGTVYPNAHACAKKLGVALSTVYVAIHNGRTDTLGLGRGKHNPDPKNNASNKAITVMGRTYQSRAALSRAMHRNLKYVAKALRKYGQQQATEMFAARLMWVEAQQETKQRKEREQQREAA